MIGAFERVKPATSLDKRQVKAGRLTYQAVRDPKFRRQALAAVKALARHGVNPAVASNLAQLYLALGETEPALGAVENLCRASPVACTDLAVNPIYRALHGRPRFRQLAEKYAVAAPE